MLLFKTVLTNRSVSIYGTKNFMIPKNRIPIFVRVEETNSSVRIRQDHSNVHVRTVTMELMVNVMISMSVK